MPSIQILKSFNELFSGAVRFFGLLLYGCENELAHKECKAEKSVEALEVSAPRTPDFHNLINTCVENLMVQKYFLGTSAFVLPSGQRAHFDRYEIWMIQYESGCA